MSLLHLLKKGGVRSLATAIPATFATDVNSTHQQVAKIATVAVAMTQIVEIKDICSDPDRHCWPHSTAMNRAEIHIFEARILRFTGKGISADDAETLADRLVLHDRDNDDRQVCLECSHLSGYGRSWRCGNWKIAGIALRSRDAQLPLDLVLQLQRCDGFATVIRDGNSICW